MTVFLDAMASYTSAWFTAFSPAGRRHAPLSVRRCLVLLLFPLFLLVQLMHWVFLALDELLFPAYRHCRLRQPVFVLGVPRSGTTFLHRALAGDSRFTAPASWEVMVAPSVCQRRFVAWLARADAAVGSPLRRLLERVLRRLGSGMESVHPIGLDAAEEDYLALLPSAGCFFALLAFPHHRAFRDLAVIRELPPARRNRLLDHYHRLLQRHVYAHGDAQLLSKNAAFATWAPFLAARYPDAVFLLCIREPAAALASQLTSVAGARALFASFPADPDLEALFADLYGEWWAALEAFARQQCPPPLVIEQEWLRGHTDAVLTQIYAHLDRPGSAAAARPAPLSTAGGAVSGAQAGARPGAARWQRTPGPEAPGAAYAALAALSRAQRDAVA